MLSLQTRRILPIIFLFVFLAISSATFSQSITISGTVKSAAGEPLYGASVMEQGQLSGTFTGQDGTFKLNVSKAKPTLVFSFVGFETQQVPWNGSGNFSVQLEPAGSNLTDVVVVGYGTQKRQYVTGAVAQVSGKEITAAPAANASQLLAGRLPGLVTKTNSSLPGADGAALQIRGFGTALIIVDGLPTDFNRVDPNDIESISVLKDASAAIYGARAGNGVILVTTKRGKGGAPTINYSGTYTTQSPTAFQTQVNAGDFAELRREAALNYGLNPGEFTGDVVQKFKAGTEPNYGSYSWKDALFRNNAPMYQQNLSVSGGSQGIKYFASVGMTDQQSVFTSGDYYYKRYNARLNVDATVSKNLTMRFDLQYRVENRQQVADVDVVMIDFQTAQPRYSPFLPDPTKNGFSGFSERNPLLRTQADRKGYNRTANNFFNGLLGLQYAIPFVQGLKIGGDLIVSQSNNYQKEFSLPADLHTYDYETKVYTYLASMGNTITLREPLQEVTRFTRGQQSTTIAPLVIT